MRGLALATAAACLGATALVAAVPAIHFAYRSPDLHVALMTAEALIGLLAAYLAFERFRRRRRLDDLVLCGALALLVLAKLSFSVVPAIVSRETTAFASWAATGGQFLGHVVFMAAAFVGAVGVRRLSRARSVLLVLAPLLALGALAALLAVVSDGLPEAVPGTPTPEASGRVRLEGHWALLAAQLAGVALYAAAAVGFARRAQRTGEALLAWFAIAAVLAATARLNYFLHPSLFTEWVYTGDVLRLLFWLVVLAAAITEIHDYSRGVGAAATLEERRRIARDLHDGLAQELASIVRNLRSLEGDDRFATRARASAERALHEARRAIAALSDGWDRRLDAALAEAARSVAEREGTRVVLDLQPGVEVRPDQREALVLISSEAITNAARHSRAATVHVELAGGRRPRLRITDRGCGFDPGAVPSNGARAFGLLTMRERAEGIGAQLSVTSAPGEGTAVEVTL